MTTKILLTSHQPEVDNLQEKSSFLQDHNYDVTTLNAQTDELGSEAGWFIILWPVTKCSEQLSMRNIDYFLKLLKLGKRISFICPVKPLGFLEGMEWYRSWDNFVARNFLPQTK